MKKKINKYNLLMLVIFIGSLFIVISDMLVIFINIKVAGWTKLGIIVFGISVILCNASFNYLHSEYIKKEK